jgi:hypothetical protein
MKRLMSALAFALLTASTAQAAEPSPVTLSSTTEESLALRARNGVEAPRGEATIYLRFYTYHHGSTDFSYIAWRKPDGTWSVSHVGETKSNVPPPPGRPPSEAKASPEQTRVLDAADAAALDALLKSRTLGATPVQARDTGVGAPQITMEIVAPSKHVVLSWMGEPSGEARQVSDIVLGFPH